MQRRSALEWANKQLMSTNSISLHKNIYLPTFLLTYLITWKETVCRDNTPLPSCAVRRAETIEDIILNIEQPDLSVEWETIIVCVYKSFNQCVRTM